MVPEAPPADLLQQQPTADAALSSAAGGAPGVSQEQQPAAAPSLLEEVLRSTAAAAAAAAPGGGGHNAQAAFRVLAKKAEAMLAYCARFSASPPQHALAAALSTIALSMFCAAVIDCRTRSRWISDDLDA